MPYFWHAVKGTQKSTDYFLTNLTFSAIDRLVILPEDELGIKLLADEEPLQRKISWTRVRNEMKRYLVDVDDSFYSSLTLFILPRDLQPATSGPGEDYNFFPSELPDSLASFLGSDENAAMGTLVVNDSALLFPGDGQHRAASIREALIEDPGLADVLVPAVLIPYRGPDQVRQLFADLNLNAKPVNRTIGLAFETRDPRAILGRRVAELVPLFKTRLNLRTNSLPKSSENVITFNTLVNGNDALISALYPDAGERENLLANLRQKEEDSQEVNAVATSLAQVWQTMIDALPEWQKVLDEAISPGQVREGYVFAHGIGWQALALAASAMIRTDSENWAETLTETLEHVNWRRDNQQWQNVAMVGDRINNTGPGIRATAGYILDQAGFTPDDKAAADLLSVLASSGSASTVEQLPMDDMAAPTR